MKKRGRKFGRFAVEAIMISIQRALYDELVRLNEKNASLYG